MRFLLNTNKIKTSYRPTELGTVFCLTTVARLILSEIDLLGKSEANLFSRSTFSIVDTNESYLDDMISQHLGGDLAPFKFLQSDSSQTFSLKLLNALNAMKERSKMIQTQFSSASSQYLPNLAMLTFPMVLFAFQDVEEHVDPLVLSIARSMIDTVEIHSDTSASDKYSLELADLNEGLLVDADDLSIMEVDALYEEVDFSAELADHFSQSTSFATSSPFTSLRVTEVDYSSMLPKSIGLSSTGQFENYSFGFGSTPTDPGTNYNDFFSYMSPVTSSSFSMIFSNQVQGQGLHFDPFSIDTVPGAVTLNTPVPTFASGGDMLWGKLLSDGMNFVESVFGGTGYSASHIYDADSSYLAGARLFFGEGYNAQTDRFIVDPRLAEQYGIGVHFDVETGELLLVGMADIEHYKALLASIGAVVSHTYTDQGTSAIYLQVTDGSHFSRVVKISEFWLDEVTAKESYSLLDLDWYVSGNNYYGNNLLEDGAHDTVYASDEGSETNPFYQIAAGEQFAIDVNVLLYNDFDPYGQLDPGSVQSIVLALVLHLWLKIQPNLWRYHLKNSLR